MTQEDLGSASDEYDDEADLENPNLDAIPDDDVGYEFANAGTASTSGSHRGSISQSVVGGRSATRQNSETSSLAQDKETPPSPFTEGSVGYPPNQTAGTSRFKQKESASSWAPSDTLKNDWSHLPSDLQFYLNYFYENVTYLHYSMKLDSSNFLKTLFIDAALKNDALLYAVIGFSAFQRTLHNPEGKIQDFLKYYNQSVSLLLKSLRRSEKRSSSTILAILQLATIEVWVELFTMYQKLIIYRNF